jgi:hypothetical protein
LGPLDGKDLSGFKRNRWRWSPDLDPAVICASWDRTRECKLGLLGWSYEVMCSQFRTSNIVSYTNFITYWFCRFDLFWVSCRNQGTS